MSKSTVFCLACGSRRYLTHLKGCESWQIQVEFGPALQSSEEVPAAKSEGEPVHLPPSPCSCPECRGA